MHQYYTRKCSVQHFVIALFSSTVNVICSVRYLLCHLFNSKFACFFHGYMILCTVKKITIKTDYLMLKQVNYEPDLKYSVKIQHTNAQGKFQCE